MKSARAKAGSPNLRRGKAVDNDGPRYDAMESALRLSAPTATRSGLTNRILFAFYWNAWPASSESAGGLPLL